MIRETLRENRIKTRNSVILRCVRGYGIIIGLILVLTVITFFEHSITDIYIDEKIKDSGSMMELAGGLSDALADNAEAVFTLWIDNAEIVNKDMIIEPADHTGPDDTGNIAEGSNQYLFKYKGRNAAENFALFDSISEAEQLAMAHYYHCLYANEFALIKEDIGAKSCCILIPSEKTDENKRNWTYIFPAKWVLDTVGEEDKTISSDFLGEDAVFTESTYYLLEEMYRGDEEYALAAIPGEGDVENRILFRPLKQGDKIIAIAAIVFDVSGVIESVIEDTWTVIAAMALIMLLIYFGIYISLRNKLLVPIMESDAAVVEFVKSKDPEELSKNLPRISSDNEITSLSNNLLLLGRELDYYIKETANTAAKEAKLATEMSLASAIQQSILKKNAGDFPKELGIEFFAAMHPAKEIGGDLYDSVLLDEDHLCIIAGDVSGKGVPAALYMMISKVIFENACSLYDSPAAILENVNNKLYEYKSMKMMITAWVGIYEVSTGIITMANAGHEYPIIIRDKKAFRVEDKHDFVMGMVKNIKYSQYDTRLAKGDCIIIYSDGVPEATDETGRMLGMDGLINALNEYSLSHDNKGTHAADYGSLVLDLAEDFQKNTEQFDDITVVVLKRDH